MTRAHWREIERLAAMPVPHAAPVRKLWEPVRPLTLALHELAQARLKEATRLAG